jgi:MoaA/NifB/PqqE/SkfB family radical SAM enzyme
MIGFIIRVFYYFIMTKLRNPPGLKGTLFSEQEKEKARTENKLLFISLMTNSVCNLSCPDCYVGKKELKGNELTLEERKKVLDNAQDLGARTLRIAGEGEPLLDRNFWETIDHATNKLGLDAFFFTNGTKIDEETATRIYENPRLTAVLKFSGSPRVMEYLTGNMGKFREEDFIEHDGIMIPKYVKNMIDVGMNQPDESGNSRLGIEFLLRKSNYGFAFDIFRWARRNNVVPYFEQNLEAGSANVWSSYTQERVDDKDAFALSQRLLEIDENEFGFTWKPSIPYLVGGICESELDGCKKFTYNIVVSSNGEMYPCYAANFSLGNIRDVSLREGLNNPIRRKLLENSIFNCLCRVYSRSSVKHNVHEVEDLDTKLDYQYGGNENA